MSTELLADEHVKEINDDLVIIQKKNGLTFGTDAYLLASYVHAEPRALCVDLGSGTGIVSLLLLQRKRIARAIGVEIQPDFSALIERNAVRNGRERQLSALCADVRILDQALIGKHLGETQGRAADIVVCNPPYMKVDCGRRNEHDEKYIARHEVCGDIGDFCAAAARVLRYGGRFYTVYRPDRLIDLTVALRECRLEPKKMTFVHADAESEPCMVLVEARAGGAAGMVVTAPLLLHAVESRAEKSRPLSEAAQRVYDTMTL